jgi:hypothetical protein
MAISEITCVYTPPGSPLIVLPDIDLTGTDSDAGEISLDASPTFHEEDVVLDAFEKISAETQKENTEFLTGWPHNTGNANLIKSVDIIDLLSSAQTSSISIWGDVETRPAGNSSFMGSESPWTSLSIALNENYGQHSSLILP